MKNVKLATAVLATIQDFRNNNKDFSAFDVTKSLRNLANQGLLTLSDQPAEDIGGVNTYNISHESVKALVTEFQQNNLLPDFTKDYGDYHGNSFILYKYTPTIPAPIVTASVGGVAIPVKVLAPAPILTQSKSINDINDKVVLDKIDSYVSSRTYPTLKSVQGAIRRYGNFTVKQIADACQKLGYSISSDADTPYYLSIIN